MPSSRRGHTAVFPASAGAVCVQRPFRKLPMLPKPPTWGRKGSMNFDIALVLAGSVAALILGLAGWYYFYRRPRDERAPHRLGREMGLGQLNEGGRQTPVWYGGRLADHEFALTYANLRYGRYGRRPARTVEDVILSLRLALAVDVPAGQDIVAYFQHGREFAPGETPPDFDFAFDRRHTDRLSEESRQALLAFTQNFGSLRLRDRAGAPPALFVPEALPEAHVVLVHDRPGHKQTPAEVGALLDALQHVAGVLEADPAFAAQESPFNGINPESIQEKKT